MSSGHHDAERPPITLGSPGTRALVASIVVLAVILLPLPPLLWAWLHVSAATTAKVGLAGRTLDVTVADTALRQRVGLQGRPAPGEDGGMLFLYGRAEPRRFGRGTLDFPLDVVFISPDDAVSATATLDPAHPLATSPSPAEAVLELKSGWCVRHSVAIGDPVALP